MFINPKKVTMAMAGFKERLCGTQIPHIPHCVSVHALITAQLLAQNGQILNT
jgi:hypothetical protein